MDTQKIERPALPENANLSGGALVVLSGGQDSATCLFLALSMLPPEKVHCVTFDYGQRHSAEIEAAREVARLAGIPPHQHVVYPLDALSKAAPSALTREAIAVKADGGLHDLPSTFVPGRNLVFLTLAASYALSRGIKVLVTGVCQTDYSGYPDCREPTILALAEAIRLGADEPDFSIWTPLMRLTKAETVQLAYALGDECVEAVGRTLTCYNGKRPGCGTCPACELRAKGFAEAGQLDPAA